MTAESYANHPKSISELKADRTDAATDWTPRDVLIRLLRKIDDGECVPDALIVCWHEADDKNGHHYSTSSPNGLTTIGLLEATKTCIATQMWGSK